MRLLNFYYSAEQVLLGPKQIKETKKYSETINIEVDGEKNEEMTVEVNVFF